MSSLRQDLLDRVLAEPSRGNCAVYADHLAELGDPRGELINLELALERPADAWLRGSQKARRAELVAEHGPRWWPWLERGSSAFVKLRTRFGMVRELLQMPAGRLARFPHAFDEEPLETLHIVGEDDPQLGGAGPWLPRLRRLRLSSAVAEQALHDLLARPEPLSLVELRSGIRPLGKLRERALPGLEVLELHGPRLEPAWLEAHAGALRVLRLPDSQPELDRAAFPLLELLGLHLDAGGLAGLCQAAARFPRLRRLELGNYRFEEGHVQALLASQLPHLAELAFRHLPFPGAHRLVGRYRVFRLR